MIYDTIIIGAGPAGFTAAIYASRREMKTLIVSKDLGGQVLWASEIENYPGFKKIQAFELISRMQEQVSGLGVEIKLTEVKKIEKKDDLFVLITAKEKIIAKTLIIAMGLVPRRLEIPGESEFNGKGVSYCSNCDGPLYKGQDIAVVGGGNSALDAAEVLSKIGRKVYLIHRSDKFRAFEALIKEVRNRENIVILTDTVIEQIKGQNKVESLILKNTQTGAQSSLAVGGVFIEIGRIAHTDLLDGWVERDEGGQVLVDANGKTSYPGIFAAGDVTQVEFKQITVACGSATLAALSAYQYLQTKNGRPSAPIKDYSRPK